MLRTALSSSGLFRKRWRGGLGVLLGGWALMALGSFLAELGRWSVAPSPLVLRTLALLVLSLWSFWFTGWRLRRCLDRGAAVGWSALESSLVEVALGSFVAVTVLTVGGFLHIYGEPFAWCLLLAPLVGPQGSFLRELRERLVSAPPLGRSWPAAVLLGATGAMTLAASLAPETSQDALVYHLALPARYIEAGGIVEVPGSFYAAFPQNAEMLFLLGLLLDGDGLAKSFHWLSGAGSVLAVAALARRLLPLEGSERARGPAMLAALLFGTVPTVALIAGWAYVDLTVVFFSTLSSLVFLRYAHASRQRGTAGLSGTLELVLAALLAGAAAGCKYTAGAQGLVLLAALAVVSRAQRWPLRRLAAAALIVSAVVLACVLPWFLKNAAFTGNPLFPFAHGVFGGGDWDAGRAAVLRHALASWGATGSLGELLLLPWRLSVEGRFFVEERFDGVIGPAFLMGFPVLVAGLRLGASYRLAGAFLVLHVAFWLLGTHQVRFLLPALALAAALTAAAVHGVLRAPLRSALIALLGAAAAVNVALVALHHASHNPLPVLLGLESRDAYLQREVPGGDYVLFRHIEKHLPRDSLILFGSCGNPGFLCKRPYVSDAFFENRTLARLLGGAARPDAVLERMRSEGFTHLLFRFENVFDPAGIRSEIPLRDQRLLAEFLNRHARQEFEANGTVLFALSSIAAPPAAGGRLELR
jgi:hypothetical protein